MGTEEKGIRVITFSGKDADCRKWKLCFLAKASNNEYREVLLGEEKVPADRTVLAKDDAGARLLQARKMNIKAYSTLCMSCEGAAFGIGERGFTPSLPNGSVYEAWKALCKKYEPATQISWVALKKQFGHCAMSKDQDLDQWIAELTYLRSRIDAVPNSVPMSDEEMISYLGQSYLGLLRSHYFD
jgi:gag-polypeptide of LTR copia-type